MNNSFNYFRKHIPNGLHYENMTSTLFFYQLLASEQNLVGSKVQKDIRKFKAKYKNSLNAVETLPNPVTRIFILFFRQGLNFPR